MKEIVIASAARTAGGDFGGSLAGFTPTQLGVVAATAAIERAQSKVWLPVHSSRRASRVKSLSYWTRSGRGALK